VITATLPRQHTTAAGKPAAPRRYGRWDRMARVLRFIRVSSGRRYRVELILVPLVLGLLGKIVGGIIVFFIAIGFVPGIIIGWLLGRTTS
jgi:hypothetical protein